MIVTQKNGRRKSVTTPSEVDAITDALIAGLTEEERILMRALQEDLNDDITMSNELELHTYHTIPVSMEQFLDDPYYLGEACSTIYPAIRDDLIRLFNRPYREVLNTGSIGVGKSYAASIAICRLVYEFSCMISPQNTLGLSSSSTLVIPLVSKNLVLARDVLKAAIDEKIKQSPYFMTKCAPDFRKDYTLFPNNIRINIASYISDRILGTDVISVILDETNFPPKRHGQQITTGFGQKLRPGHFDIVEKMYRGLLRRIKSRFQKAGGGFNGMMILVSSAATTESFTERIIKERKDDPEFFLTDHTQWTAKPSDRFSGEVFYILCSTSAIKSRILREDEYELITDKYLEANDAFVMDIPVEFMDDFESNMEDALRDIAGFSTEAVSQFIQRPKMIQVCTNFEREHPFSKEEWISGSPGSFNWGELCIKYERQLPGGFTEPAYKPRRNPFALRWCHIDTSISGDCSGFCIAHIERWVDVVRRDSEGNKDVDIAPFYVIDFMLRIWPPPSEQIYMPDLRTMLYQFEDHGFRFIGFSCDQFQSSEMLQQVKRKGIASHLISVDRTTEPYDELKSALYEKRIELYPYEPLVHELKKLEYDRLLGKIDHPQHECFVGSTRIPLLDGTCAMIEELDGIETLVYSCTKDGKIVPGLARGMLTKYTDELVDVILDSGAVERCTPEHLWMLRDGSYKCAIDLVPGVDRLMPINRCWPISGGKVIYIIPVKLKQPVPVYDLEVDTYNNFALLSGVFVHNSKDCSDAVCGALWGLRNSSTKMPMNGLREEKNVRPHEHAWVSPLIPSDQIDPEDIRITKEDDSSVGFMPIMFGDDDPIF